MAKIYKVTVDNGKEGRSYLIRAESSSKARAHALRIVGVKIATADDVVTLGADTIENAED
jgi:hypothetical protein